MILVTGGNGFIGRYVCSTLAAKGKELISLDVKAFDYPHKPQAVHFLTCDILDTARIEQIFRQYEITTIIHLASMLNTASRRHPFDASKVNIMGSLNLLEAARSFQVSKFIYGSSISVYGSPHPCMTKESSSTVLPPPVPEDLYGAAKRYVELVGDAYSQQYGLQFIALRIASVIGPGAGSPSSPWRDEIFEKLGLSRQSDIIIPYQKTEQVPLVYVGDVAEMFACLVDAQSSSLNCYDTPSETWTFHELATTIESLDPSIRIIFGNAMIQGIPPVVSGHQFIHEFGYRPRMSIRERLTRRARKGFGDVKNFG